MARDRILSMDLCFCNCVVATVGEDIDLRLSQERKKYLHKIALQRLKSESELSLKTFYSWDGKTQLRA